MHARIQRPTPSVGSWTETAKTVAVTLLLRKIDGTRTFGVPPELKAHHEWPAFDILQRVRSHCWIQVAGRETEICAWKHEVKDTTGRVMPVLFLDTDLHRNSERDRAITDCQEDGNNHDQFFREAVLSIGGPRMLRTLGYNRIKRMYLHDDGVGCEGNLA
jgi:starch phosphorylase